MILTVMLKQANRKLARVDFHVEYSLLILLRFMNDLMQEKTLHMVEMVKMKVGLRPRTSFWSEKITSKP